MRMLTGDVRRLMRISPDIRRRRRLNPVPPVEAIAGDGSGREPVIKPDGKIVSLRQLFPEIPGRLDSLPGAAPAEASFSLAVQHSEGISRDAGFIFVADDVRRPKQEVAIEDADRGAFLRLHPGREINLSRRQAA